MMITGCATLNYYSGTSADKENISQVLLLHAQSVINGSEAGHKQTQVEGAIHAGSFTGEHPSVKGIRAETSDRVAEMAAPRFWIPPERELVAKVRLTKVDIKFLEDTIAFVTFREVGFDGMDRRVYQHDVAAFLSKEGRSWLIYSMAGGDVVFDREGLDKYWMPETQGNNMRRYEP
jgi:hypothetical protein